MPETTGRSAKLRARAPGKLMLFGEYAVLEGATAVLTAIDRHVELSQRRDPPPHEPPRLIYQLGEEQLTIALDQRGPGGHLLVPPSDCATLPLAVIETLCPDEPEKLAGLRVAVVVDAMTERLSGRKLGLGSSAASSVVLTGALGHALGHSCSPQCVFELAFAAHRRFQGGKGSGADVAAAAFGGLIAYRLESWTQPTVEALGSAGLPPWRAVWIGHSADTRRFIDAIEALRATAPRRHEQLLGRMAEVAELAATAVREGRAADVLDLVHEAELRADALGAAAGLEIVTDAHRELARRARKAGIYTKISGAGGGDLSLVFGPDPEALDAFCTSLLGTGLTPVALHACQAGFESEQ